MVKIRVGKAYDRVGAGVFQATQDTDSDGNDTPQSGMQSKVEIMETAEQVLPDDNSSSNGDDSDDENIYVWPTPLFSFYFSLALLITWALILSFASSVCSGAYFY